MQESLNACSAAPEKVKRKWKANPLPSREYLLECFRYEPETGKLFWNDRPLSHFKDDHFRKVWRSRHMGNEAGAYKYTKAGDPAHVYVRTGKRERHMAHRIIWVMERGSIPENMQVDHRDGNPFNNGLGNLRLATCAQNQWNSGIYRTNGEKRVMPKGIRFNGSSYFGQCQHNKVQHRTKMCSTIEEAIEVHQRLLLTLRPDFVRL